MTNAAFDTLTMSKDLQDAGFEARQAEAIALAARQAQGDLATKQDISLLMSDINQLRTVRGVDIAWIRCLLLISLALSVVILGAVIALLQ